MSAQENPSRANRRDFIKSSTGMLVGGSQAASLGTARAVHAAGSDILKVGLIGCGGRGSGAAVNAMHAEDNVRLTAMADAFSDRLQGSRETLKKQLKEAMSAKTPTNKPAPPKKLRAPKS